MMTAWMLLAAYILDRLIGDPRWLPHPVVGMGKAIAATEKQLRRIMGRWKERGTLTPMRTRLLGVFLPIVVVGGTFSITWLLVKLADAVHPWLGWGVETVLVAITIATKGLADAGRAIWSPLVKGDLTEARRALSMVVGRDTERLDDGEIVRGAVETIAENIVDAVTAPLFFAAIGGAPLAMAYRAVNTLDAMVGYRDERYLYLGWASARLDDLANWLPARLTVCPMLAAMWVLRLDGRRAWQIIKRDAHRHPSPNSGIPEAAMAGGLHIRLGGTNWYRGVPSHRGHLGDPTEAFHPRHICQSIRVLYWTTGLYVCMLAVVIIAIDVATR
jgi:adenosylcobinamide-phosphate synthase